MPVSIGAKAQAGFDRPLDLLQDCHRRIEYFLSILQRVAASEQEILDDEHRTALEAALRYFREAAPRHTADEEQSLFPRLRRETGNEIKTALARIDALESDHHRADVLHGEVDRLGRQWLRDGTLTAAERAGLRSSIDDLLRLYAEHIRIEDREIFALAGKVLSPSDIASVGQEMKARRHLGGP
jgi:hemerythrin-like domain-containing protein